MLFDGAESWVRYLMTLDRAGSVRGLDIDRIDNQSHYMEGNLRFVTRATNLRNKSTNQHFEYRGVTLVAVDVYDAIIVDYPSFGLARSTTARMAGSGYSLDQILAAVPRRKRS